jgi:hypothetical protein
VPPRAERVLRVAGVPLIVVGVLAWLAVTVLRAGSAGDPAAYAEYVDPATGSYIDVQLDDASPTFGTFSVVVPGAGRVWPVPDADVDTSRGPGGTVELRYDGPGLRDPQVQPRVPYDPPREQTEPQEVQLRLAAQVDTERQVATVEVWVDGDRQRLQGSAPLTGARPVVEDFLEAVRAGDWDRVYTLESMFMRNGSKRGDFVVNLANAGAITSVSAARPTGETEYSTRAGASYARTPIRLTYGTGPDAPSVDATLVLALTGGRWSVLSVE